jgi:hypothetical protein
MCARCDHVIHPTRLAAATRAADRRPSSAMPAPGAFRNAAKRVLVVLGVLAVIGGVATVALVYSLVRQANEIAAARAVEQAKTIERLRTVWPAIDAAAARASRDIKGAGAEGRQPLRELLAALAPTTASPVRRAWFATMDADTTAFARYGQAQFSSLPSGDRPGRIVRAALPARLADSLEVQLAKDTLSPWIGVYRRVAASPLPPAAWAYRPEVPGANGPFGAPQFGLGVLKALTWGNGAAALLALDAGDRRGAVQRARENVAMAHLVARSPSMVAYLVGRQQLRESAALLGHVGRLAEDSVATADAAALVLALDGQKGLRYAFGPAPEARDPKAAAVLAIVRDTLLPPAVRTETALQVVTGSCLSARESLVGVGDDRQPSLDAAVAGLADLDPEGRLRPVMARTLTEWRGMTSDGAAMLGGWSQRPTWGDALTAVGLGGVAGRTVACTLL